MDERSLLIAAFTSGVVIQALILIRGDWNWWKLGGSVFLALFVIAYGSDKPGYDQADHIRLGLFLFAGMFALLFKEDILPRVSEKLLLSYTITFWYAFFTYYYQDTGFQITVLCVCLVASWVTVFFAFEQIRLTTAWKIIFYTWFLWTVVGLCVFRFAFSQLSIFSMQKALPWISPVDALLGGMAFLYLVVNAFYLYYLIPIPGRSQSWDSRMKDWHEFTDLIGQRFQDILPSHIATCLILVVQGGGLLINYVYRWVPSDLLVSALILLPGVILSMKRPVEVDSEQPS